MTTAYRYILAVLLLSSPLLLAGQNTTANSEEFPDSCLQGNQHLIGWPDSARWATCRILLDICRNLADPKDSLFMMYKGNMAMHSVALHSQNEQKAYWLNFWSGGSGEVNYIYQQDERGLYRSVYYEGGWYSATRTSNEMAGFYDILLTKRYANADGSRGMMLVRLNSLGNLEKIRKWIKPLGK